MNSDLLTGSGWVYNWCDHSSAVVWKMPRYLLLLVVAPTLLMTSPFERPCLAQADKGKLAEEALEAVERATRERPAVTVAEETTRIVRPLSEHGYVDYLAALNDEYGKGVTPENNAAVQLWRAIGPEPIPERARQAFFDGLGIRPLAEEGSYFVRFEDFVGRQQVHDLSQDQRGREKQGAATLWESLFQVVEDPSSGEELALLAGWVEANRDPMKLLVEASRQPHFFAPLVRGEESALLATIALPGYEEFREAVAMLVARAMLRLSEERIDEAWQDVLAAHRLARLVGQGPVLVGAAVAIGMDTTAWYGDLAVATHGHPTPEQARQFICDLSALPPLPDIAEKLDRCERYTYLDTIAAVAREGPEVLREDGKSKADEQISGLSEFVADPVGAALAGPARRTLIDWDDALRMGNAFYDRLEQVPSQSSYRERMESFRQLERQVLTIREELEHPFSTIAEKTVAGQSMSQIVAKWIGEIILSMSVPVYEAALQAKDRAVVQGRMAQIAMALAGHRAEHGLYPEQLATITPRYFSEVPEDLFAGNSFHYQRTDGGCVLYSVGRNARDDKQMSELRYPPRLPEAEDAPGEESAGDDIVVKM